MHASATFLQKGDSLPPEQLVRMYQEDRNTLWIYFLMRRYQHLIASYSMRASRLGYLQEDIQQDLFIHLSKKLVRAQIHTNFTAWFLVVVRNFLIDLANKENKRKLAQKGFHEKVFKTELPRFGTSLDVDKMLERAKEELSEVQYQCLTLFFVEDLSYAEIAKRLEISTKQVDNALRLAKNKLKKAYQIC